MIFKLHSLCPTKCHREYMLTYNWSKKNIWIHDSFLGFKGTWVSLINVTESETYILNNIQVRTLNRYLYKNTKVSSVSKVFDFLSKRHKNPNRFHILYHAYTLWYTSKGQWIMCQKQCFLGFKDYWFHVKRHKKQTNAPYIRNNL